ncbi:putative sulfate exporter family transporter [Rhodobacter sp. NTK016B]|uniref:YeiH family protein n=1 Tax=Rhodobacter sp. NTK016B TaxID=2759676 RepID=UPI001A8E9FF4|nr:putative sulfate exporter family transporter [Rhodobacter sp. NTK016B]MBN8292306.1 putative sulfate exporter family transporter [Rhodobacter sp. NTK016B]
MIATLPLATRKSLIPLLPGLVLVAGVTALAFVLRLLPGLNALSPVIVAILLGMALSNLRAPAEAAQPGIAFAGKGLMRAAVALLGAQITLGDLGAFGIGGGLAVLAAVAITLPVSHAVGRRLGVAPDLSLLIATGSAVCGASAIAGANGVIRARDEVVSYAVATITLWGTIGLFAVPLASGLLGLTPVQSGLWAGLSLHEVAQAVGAGFAGGEVSGQAALAMKLGRVLMLAGVVAVLARGHRGEARGQGAGVPGFLWVFMALVVLNTLGMLAEPLRMASAQITPVLLAAALAGLGLNTRFARLRALGLAPLVQSGAAFAMIAALGLGAALWIG